MASAAEQETIRDLRNQLERCREGYRLQYEALKCYQEQIAKLRDRIETERDDAYSRGRSDGYRDAEDDLMYEDNFGD